MKNIFFKIESLITKINFQNKNHCCGWEKKMSAINI